jgi:hypothetical protein
LAALERRKNVAARYLRGQTQWEIARAFEVNQCTVSRDLEMIHKEWLAQAVLADGERTAHELAKLDEVERQAWASWERSKENAEIIRARMRGEGEGAQVETEKIIRGQVGDPRFLDIVLKCVERRCKLLGLDEIPASGNPTIVTVLEAVDLDVILGRKPGLTHDNIGAGSS